MPRAAISKQKTASGIIIQRLAVLFMIPANATMNPVMDMTNTVVAFNGVCSI